MRVGYVDEEFVVNPTHSQRAESSLDLIVVGTENAVTMVECGAKELSEETMIEAIKLAHEAVKELCATQNALREQAGEEVGRFYIWVVTLRCELTRGEGCLLCFLREGVEVHEIPFVVVEGCCKVNTKSDVYMPENLSRSVSGSMQLVTR